MSLGEFIRGSQVWKSDGTPGGTRLPAAPVFMKLTVPPRRILETLSREFECCVYGLGLVRKEWERYRGGGFSPMLIGPG